MKPINDAEVARLTAELERVSQMRSEYLAGDAPLADAVRVAKQNLVNAMATFEVGDPVIWIDGKKEHKAVITDIRYDYGKPEYFVKVLKQDGTPGARERRVYFTGVDKVLRLDESRVVSDVGGAGV
jgi:hypothetical protein